MLNKAMKTALMTFAFSLANQASAGMLIESIAADLRAQ